jgi:hypothetical protein
MSIFKIQIKAGTPATFDPNPQKVCVNDSVFWFNGDKVAHQPCPVGNPTGFMQFPVTPGASSAQVSFGTPKTIKYTCAKHPLESGTIVVSSCKKKGAFGYKTKKGAFGYKTKKGPFGGKTKKGAFASKTKLGTK